MGSSPSLQVVADGVAGGDLGVELGDVLERDDLGDAAADDLLLGQAKGLGLAGVDAQVAKFDGIEECEADRRGLVDGLELGALALGLLLTLLEFFGEGLAVVDVDVDSEPVEDVAVLVADGLGADPPPAGAAIAGADEAGFDIVVDSGGDGAAPGLEDAPVVVGVEGLEPAAGLEVFGGEAEVVEEALVGVGDAAVGGAHPDGLGVEVGEDAVAGLAGAEGIFVALAIGDVDREAAQACVGRRCLPQRPDRGTLPRAVIRRRHAAGSRRRSSLRFRRSCRSDP